jgi:hypothetical protein
MSLPNTSALAAAHTVARAGIERICWRLDRTNRLRIRRRQRLVCVSAGERPVLDGLSVVPTGRDPGQRAAQNCLVAPDVITLEGPS